MSILLFFFFPLLINTVGLSVLAGVMCCMSSSHIKCQLLVYFFCALSHQKANTWRYFLQAKLSIRDEASSVLHYNMLYAVLCFLLRAVVLNWSARNQKNDCSNLCRNLLWNEGYLCCLLRFIWLVPLQTLFLLFFQFMLGAVLPFQAVKQKHFGTFNIHR